MTRAVTDILYRTDGTAWASAPVTFERKAGSFDDGSSWPPDEKQVTTDATGAYSVDLWPDAAGALHSRYRVSYPNGDTFYVSIPDGTAPITMPEIRVAAVTPPTTPSEMDAHIHATDPHTGYLLPAEANALYAPIVSPALTGTPTGPTAATGTNTGQLATTAFVLAAVGTGGGGGGGGDWSTITGTPTTIGGYGITDAYTKGQTDAAYAPISHTQAWGTITGTPTTLGGYGITDSFSQAAADARYAPIAHTQAWSTITATPTTLGGYGITDAYTKVQTDTGLAGKANAASTLAGYGITDAYTKTAADARYAPIAHNQAWSTITGAPTTLGGYGITDAYTKVQTDAAYAPTVHTHTFASLTARPTTIGGYGITDAYTKAEVDTALSGKANAATTLAGYGITDAYTKGQTDAAYAPIAHNQAWSTITATPTTIGGYGIADAVTLGTAQTITGIKTFSGPQPFVLDGGAGAASFLFNTPAGFARNIVYQSAAVNRWLMGANATAETGSNTGSNFVFQSRDDTGASLSSVLYMRRNGQVGINTAPLARLHVTESDAATSTVSTVVLKEHTTTGIPAAGFGSRDRIQMDSSTNTSRMALDQEVTWATATDASRKARVVLNVYDTLAREGLRLEASGTAPMIGFLGASAAIRQTLPAAATDATTTQALANALRTALITFGLGA